MHQQVAWYVSLALILIVGAAFAFTALHSTRPPEPASSGSVRHLGLGILLALVALGTVAAAATLTHLPYAPPADGNPVRTTIEAVGRQWTWSLSAQRARVGETVEFLVTSTDVNHGFGLYDSEMHLLAETQAMPGHTNRLYYRFERPGPYRVLCLEYCGLAHAAMSSAIEVSQ